MENEDLKWLGDDGIILWEDIIPGKLNIIDAPCGCGKTTFVEKKLPWLWITEVLYLVDTANGLEAFKKRGTLKEYNGKEYYKNDRITAMTYATFATLCTYNPDAPLWNTKYDLIVCDELQSVIKWSKIHSKDINLHTGALLEIHKRIAIGARVVAISATTFNIKEEFKDEFVITPIHGELKHYTVEKTIEYRNIWNLLPQLPLDKRGIIYVPHIKTMIDISNFFAEQEIKAVMVFSKNNKTFSMDDEKLKVRNSILTHEKIPDDVQVLLINAASETGINIKSDVDYIVVNSGDPDTVTQVIGRVRNDIHTAYVLAETCKEQPYISHLDEKWLNRWLSTEDKEELCRELNFRDKRGRLIGWTTIKKALKFNYFEVYNTHKRTGDYSLITR